MSCVSVELGCVSLCSKLLWSAEDNKTFELALARHFRDSDKWAKIALLLPGKTMPEIQRAYELLQDDVKRIDDSGYAAVLQAAGGGASSSDSVKKPKLDLPSAANGATSAQAQQADRRKGVPWTHEEHRLFLLGLGKFGKGSWRSIARQFVVTRTPTQVASHAQKYFLRLNSMKDKKDKRRASIHDLTPDQLAAREAHPSAAQRKLIKA